MSIIERIKELLGIRKKQQQLEEPKHMNEYIETSNNWKASQEVEQSKLNEERQKQEIEKERKLQLLYAVKNICGKNNNLSAKEINELTKSNLEGVGHFGEMQLSELDLEILSRINIDFNVRPHEDIDKYINESRYPADKVEKLIDSVKQNAIENAKLWGRTEEHAKGYIVPPIDTFRDIIQKEKERENS